MTGERHGHGIVCVNPPLSFRYMPIVFLHLLKPTKSTIAVPSGCAVKGVGVWPLACCNCGLESHWGHGWFSVVSVVCCQVEVSASGWSLVQRNPTDFDVSLRVWSRNLVNEEALVPWGLSRTKTDKQAHHQYVVFWLKTLIHAQHVSKINW
jgi:hypothetical protein